MVDAQPPNSVAVAPTRRATVRRSPSWRLCPSPGPQGAGAGPSALVVERDSQALICSALAAPGSTRPSAATSVGVPVTPRRSASATLRSTGCAQSALGGTWSRVISACQAPRRSFAHQTAIAFARACGCREAIGIRKVWIVTSDRPFNSASSRRQCGQSGSLKIASAREPRPRTSLIASASGSVEVDARQRVLALGGEVALRLHVVQVAEQEVLAARVHVGEVGAHRHFEDTQPRRRTDLAEAGRG